MSDHGNIIVHRDDDHQCGDACGYAAAMLAAICFGSFGVPVKSDVVSRLDVDPLVMQVRLVRFIIFCRAFVAMGGQGAG
jgi:hypothetical protein